MRRSLALVVLLAACASGRGGTIVSELLFVPTGLVVTPLANSYR